MTVVEAANKVGTTAKYPCNGLVFDVKIVNVKNGWGNIRFEIEPVSGKAGTTIFVNESSLIF